MPQAIWKNEKDYEKEKEAGPPLRCAQGRRSRYTVILPAFLSSTFSMDQE